MPAFRAPGFLPDCRSCGRGSLKIADEFFRRATEEGREGGAGLRSAGVPLEHNRRVSGSLRTPWFLKAREERESYGLHVSALE
jgi:hypothetical protein